MLKKIIFIFFASSIYCQLATANNFTILGNVKDSISGENIVYAHILILNESDNSIIKMGVTDAKGNYRIDGISYGNYHIQFSCLGYKTKIISGIQLSTEQKKIRIDALINVDINVLEEAVIVANRPSIEFRPDKKIVYIDQAASAGGARVADFLISIPEIKVEGNNVTLKTYNPTILVNGKPASAAMQDLTQVPASLISSVEIITNPSVQHNPEGLGGIINLKTRRFAEGINGMVQGSASTNNRHNGIGTINYRTKKWNMFANVWDRYLGTKISENMEQIFDTGDIFFQTHESNQKINRISTRIGTDFEPDSMTVFTVYWEFSKRYGTIDNNNKWKESGILSNRINASNQKFDLDSRDNNLGFLFVRNFRNKGELNVDVIQMFGYEPTDANFLFKYSDPHETINYYNKSSWASKNSYININYSSPIFSSWTFLVGTTLNIQITEIKDSLSDNLNVGYNHIFEMNRLINAYYMSLGKNFGKFGINAGIRGEYINQKLFSADFQSNMDDIGFFPNIGISYRHNNNFSCNMNYGRRIARPSISGLMPYATINQTYPSERYIGNPNLKPAYTSSVDFGCFFMNAKFSTNYSASYMRTGNDFAEIYFTENNIFYRTRQNIATVQKILLSANLDYHSMLLKIYRPILTVRLGQDFYDTPDIAGKNIHKSFFNYHLSLNNILYLPDNLYIYFLATYYPRTYMYASKTEEIIDLSLWLRKTFKNNLTVQASFNNILNSATVIKTDGNGFTSQQNIYPNTRSINFGIMYKFGKPINTRARVNLNLHDIEIQ
jgi:hypothetical protein